jgi:hypothetical protein
MDFFQLLCSELALWDDRRAAATKKLMLFLRWPTSRNSHFRRYVRASWFTVGVLLHFTLSMNCQEKLKLAEQSVRLLQFVTDYKVVVAMWFVFGLVVIKSWHCYPQTLVFQPTCDLIPPEMKVRLGTACRGSGLLMRADSAGCGCNHACIYQ